MSDTLHEDLSMSYCCRRHNFDVKAFMQKFILFKLLTVTYLNGTHGTHCCFPVATMVMRMRHIVSLLVHNLSCYNVGK
jgi:hypothetical protein